MFWGIIAFLSKIFFQLFELFFCFTVLQKCDHATEHVFIPSFLSMKLLHKIVEIYASIKGLHELQTKYCHNVCASFSPRIQGTINIKGISLFTILKVRRFHTLILFFKSTKILKNHHQNWPWFKSLLGNVTLFYYSFKLLVQENTHSHSWFEILQNNWPKTHFPKCFTWYLIKKGGKKTKNCRNTFWCWRLK